MSPQALATPRTARLQSTDRPGPNKEGAGLPRTDAAPPRAGRFGRPGRGNHKGGTHLMATVAALPPALLHLLMNETETRTSRLNFLRAVPAGSIGAFAAVAAVVVLLAFAPALAFPDQYGELGQRFLMPWHTPPTVAPYAVEVTPGDV